MQTAIKPSVNFTWEYSRTPIYEIRYHQKMPSIIVGFNRKKDPLRLEDFQFLPTHPKARAKEVIKRVLASGHEILG